MKVRFYADIYPYNYKDGQQENIHISVYPTWSIMSDGKRYTFEVEFPDYDFQAQELGGLKAEEVKP